MLSCEGLSGLIKFAVNSQGLTMELIVQIAVGVFLGGYLLFIVVAADFHKD